MPASRSACSSAPPPKWRRLWPTIRFRNWRRTAPWRCSSIARRRPIRWPGVRGQKDEKIRLGRREIYVHYGEGMGTSKLVIPAAKAGTARNMNTVAALAKMAAEL